VHVGPGGFGGIESQLATDDPASFAAVRDLAFTCKERFGAVVSRPFTH